MPAEARAANEEAVELQPWAQRAFERAYQHAARRGRCSRADFWAGYRAALIELQVWSQFRIRPERE